MTRETIVKQNIPEGWSEGILGYFLVIEKGKMPKKTFDEHADDCVPYLSIKHLDGLEHKYAHVSDGVLASKNDLLVIADGSGSGRMYKGYSGLVSSTFLRITSHSPEIISNDYLESIFQHLDFTNARFRKGGAIPHFDFKQLKDVQIQIPPIKEQQKIAEILGAVDEDIEKTKEVIATTEKLKRGLMQQLFTRGIGHTKFKQTEIGEVPEEWEVMKGNDISLLITKGASPKWQGYSYQKDGMAFVTSENVRDGYLDLRNPKFLPIAFHEKIKNSQLRTGDILINIVGASIGRSCKYLSKYEHANINQAVCLFRTKDSMSEDFVLQYLQNPDVIARLLGSQGGSARPNLSLADIRNFKFVLPGKEEQKKVAEILLSLDEKITVNKKLLAKLTELKKGLMQDLLSGRVRVKI